MSQASIDVNRLAPTDAAYIAGLIDGEGTVSLTRRHRNENRQLEVSISNTDLLLLRFVKGKIGGGRIARKRTYHPAHTPSSTYLISNRKALDLLRQVFPYLKTYKARRARLVLEHYVALTPRNGSYTPELAARRDRFVKTFLSANPRWTCEAPDAPDCTAAPEAIEASTPRSSSER